MPYFDDMTALSETASLSSSNLGFGGSLGIDYLITENIGLGISFNGYFGSVNSLTVKDGDEVPLSEPISLNRLDINVGLKIHFKAEMPEMPQNYGTPFMPPMFPH